MTNNDKFLLEIRNHMINQGFLPGIDGIRRRKHGTIEFALRRSDDLLEWFPLCMASIPVEKYVRKAIEMGQKIEEQDDN